MRLLKAEPDGSFSLTQFFGNTTPAYAILSHRWEEGHEFTYDDIIKNAGKGKNGYRKVQLCSKQARRHGLDYFWVDSCCIDKSNAVELQEAITSMFRWYKEAARCYVYLSDVPDQQASNLQWPLFFKKSVWFTRGWTLQELLAPASVEFFSHNWLHLGDKKTLEQYICEATRIAPQALRGAPLSEFSYDQRWSWAASRQTTREEDWVYCLFGVFSVYLPIIYGEGRENALYRLKWEIERRSNINPLGLRSDRELDCLQKLRTSDYEQFKDRNPDRYDGTCLWFLQHYHFQEWNQNNTNSRLLWVSAGPGCGKSVLAKSLIDREIKSTATRTTCYFFFKDDNEKQKTISFALSAILHQLFYQKPLLIQYAMQDYAAEGGKLTQSFHKLWSILLNATCDEDAGEVVCVFDALDECEEYDRRRLIEAIKTYHGQPPASHGTLKFLATSRPYDYIDQDFRLLIRRFPQIHLDGDLQSREIGREIDIVIRGRALELATQLELTSSELKTLQSSLMSIQSRNYLWLTLVIEVIRKTNRLKEKTLIEITGSLPRTVEQAYEAILSKIPDDERELASKILHIIVAAKRPLTLRELNIAININDDDTLELEDETRFFRDIRSICGLFIDIVDQKVFLIHQTAREFLIANSNVRTDVWMQSLEPTKSEMIMAEACIHYLKYELSRFQEKLESEESNEMTFTNYAARFWVVHFHQIQHQAPYTLLKSVDQICDTTGVIFRRWAELRTEFSLLHSLLYASSSYLHVYAYLGYDKLVKRLLNAGQLDPGMKDEHGRTPLWWAAYSGYDSIAKLLLDTGVDPDPKDNTNRTPLLVAVSRANDTVALRLLDTGQVDPNLSDKSKYTPLAWAARNGNVNVVKGLLDTGQIVHNVRDVTGLTPLGWAASYGFDAIVKLLLDTGQVDPEIKGNSGRTPLWWATYHGHKEVVRLLESYNKP